MNQEISVRIILESPPSGVDFGIQKGKGNPYETIQKQRSGEDDLTFECKISVKKAEAFMHDFTGLFVQGPLNDRFIYIDIGICAGQTDSAWTRRLKIPLKDISTETIGQLLADSSLILAAKVAGKARDGGPNCATVKPFSGWHLVTG